MVDVPAPGPLETPRGIPSVMQASLVATSEGHATARGELTSSPQPVTIVPIPYPAEATAPLIVHGAAAIDVRSDEYREFGEKFDQLLQEMRRSNEIAGETREQLVSEMRAGRTLLEAPKLDPKLIDVLLVRPLKWLAERAGAAIVGGLAAEVLRLLLYLLSTSPTIPN